MSKTKKAPIETDIDKIESLISNLKEPAIVISKDNLTMKSLEMPGAKDLVCDLCKNIPVSPMECDRCDKIFCEECINLYIKSANNPHFKTAFL